MARLDKRRSAMIDYVAGRLSASRLYNRVQPFRWGVLATEAQHGRAVAMFCHGSLDPSELDAFKLFLVHSHHGSTLPFGHLFLQHPTSFRIPYKAIIREHGRLRPNDFQDQENETIVALSPLERLALQRLHGNIDNASLPPQQRWRAEISYFRPARAGTPEAILVCRTRPVNDRDNLHTMPGDRYWVTSTSQELTTTQAAVLQVTNTYARVRAC